MRTICGQIAGRTAGASSWSLRITGCTKVLEGIILAALLHNPIPALSAIISPGQGVTLAWNRSTDPTVAGYNVYYGEVSGALTNEISAGSSTTATISGLIVGTTYYIAATTYTFRGVESALSSEVVYTVPTPLPVLQISVTPTGQFVLGVTGTVGQTYDIQATQDLENWTVIGAVTVGASGWAEFTDTNAANFSSRFYRAQQQP
jgi:hypothetical protein